MRRKSLLVVFSVVTLLAHVTLGQVVWEFGKDSQDSSVISHNKGEISTWDKVTDVHFTVPNCMKVNYVRVMVVNQWTTPAVSFNKFTNTVTISYLLLQNSKSSYEIVAKAKKIRNCGGNAKKKSTKRPSKRPTKRPTERPTKKNRKRPTKTPKKTTKQLTQSDELNNDDDSDEADCDNEYYEQDDH